MEHLQPIQFLNRHSLCVEIFPTHANFDVGFSKLCIFTNSGQKVPCEEIIYTPLIGANLGSFSVFDRMDRRMRFIVMFTFLGTDPEFFVLDATRIVPKLIVA